MTFSPHAWGWTGDTECRHHNEGVLPTRVGVDRTIRLTFQQCPVLPTRVGVDRTHAP